MKMLRITILLCIANLFLMLPNYAAAENKDANVIIFVSFSMPNESIKGWMQGAERIHAPIIIRGLINNSFKQTIQKMNELSQDNHGGMQLDPIIFKRYGVKQVPAVLIRKGNNCLPNQSCSEEFDIVYGDVHLAYALQKIATQQNALSAIAQSELMKLRNGVMNA